MYNLDTPSIFDTVSIELILLASGITFIVAYGYIFEWLRNKISFLSCYLCLGFWAGVGISAWAFQPAIYEWSTIQNFLGYYFEMGVFTSIVSMFLGRRIGDG